MSKLPSDKKDYSGLPNKKKMQVEYLTNTTNSHTSLALINIWQRENESLTALIHR